MFESRYLLFQKAEAALIEEKACKLFGIARFLDSHLKSDYDSILAASPASSREDKIAVLNAALRGLTDEVAACYPGVGVGYYSKDLNAILTYGPSSEFGDKVGLPIARDHLGWQAMETMKEVVGVGSMVRGEIMNCMRPIIRGGSAIGFVWANETLADIYAQMEMGARKVFFSPGVEPLLGLTGLLLSSSRLMLADPTSDKLVRYLRLFLNSLSLGIILADSSGTIVFVSDGTRKVLGNETGPNAVAADRPGSHVDGPASDNSDDEPGADSLASRLIGRDIREALASLGIDPALALDDACSGAKNRFATVDLRVGGTVKPVTMVSTTVQGDEGVILILEDLREARLQEERLQKAESLAVIGQLAASIAHEIRNPLTVVMGAANLLPERLSDPQFLNTFSRIAIDELGRVNRVVESLLDFARFSNPSMAPVDIESAVRRAVDVISAYASLNHVTVQTSYRPGLPPVLGDADHLVQVFLNLMLNAVQAMPGGGVMRVSTHLDRSYVKVSVEDTGCGIPPQNFDDIFDVFFTTKKDGTGLGLPLAQRIVNEHKGYIEFESESGKGTKFTVFVPAGEV